MTKMQKKFLCDLAIVLISATLSFLSVKLGQIQTPVDSALSGAGFSSIFLALKRTFIHFT
jgi:hypothetical protein